jgi:hypothetical protein
MAQAWMDVPDAARIVLDKLRFDEKIGLLTFHWPITRTRDK